MWLKKFKVSLQTIYSHNVNLKVGPALYVGDEVGEYNFLHSYSMPSVPIDHR